LSYIPCFEGKPAGYRPIIVETQDTYSETNRNNQSQHNPLTLRRICASIQPAHGILDPQGNLLHIGRGGYLIAALHHLLAYGSKECRLTTRISECASKKNISETLSYSIVKVPIIVPFYYYTFRHSVI